MRKTGLRMKDNGTTANQSHYSLAFPLRLFDWLKKTMRIRVVDAIAVVST
jgi:hypothetical protein